MIPRRSKIACLLLLTTISALCHASVYDRKIARDAEPGGIYFIAPDVSPDSLVQMHVFYSPDTGHTIYIVRTYDDDYAIHNIELAADLRPGTVYLGDCDLHTDMLVSTNHGLIWNYCDYHVSSLTSGTIIGELAWAAVTWSTDFGETRFISSGSGFPHSWEYYFSVGNASGMLWASSGDGNIYVTLDYGETFDTLCAMPKCRIRRGCLDNEAFLISNDYVHYDSIFYSLDACTTFTFRYGIDFPHTPTPGVGSSGFDRGWQQSEIIASVFGFNYTSYYPDPPPYWHGGWFRIFVSNDQGASWRLIVEHGYGAPDAVEEHQETRTIEQICFDGTTVSSTESISLFDITGRHIASGYSIETQYLSNGLYIAKTKSNSRKIYITK